MNSSSSTDRSHRGDILFFFALVAAVYVAWLVHEVLVLLYVSGLFAVVLTPVVQFVGRVRIGSRRPFRGIAILVLIAVIAAGAAGFGFLAIPPVARDMTSLAGEMPTRIQQLLDRVNNLPYVPQLDTTEIIARLQDFLSSAATHILLSLKNWVGAVVDIITGIILTVYFILDGKHAYRWFLSFFPPERRERLDQTLRRAEVRMGKWLLGQGSLMLILGITSTIVYLALGIRYPYALGVLTGLLNIIPVLGGAICITLAMLVAALDSLGRVAGVAIFYIAYVWIENSFLTPRIMRNSVDLPALGILVALLLGSALEGIPGAMVSIPTAVLVTVLVDEYLVYKKEKAED
jgi:predicted PurR-regulated permease PerM